MRIAAVIPNWNGRRYLEALFRSMAGQDFAEVIVVDNGSTDGSAEWAESSGARVIRLDRNLGFARAVNTGAEAANADALAILNNDVTLAPDWLQRMLDALRAGNPIACGKVLSAAQPDRIDATFDALCQGGTAWRCGHGALDGPIWSQSRTAPFVPLTAAVVRRDVFREVGGLDSVYESYLEDVDFGLRCATAGYCALYVPEALAWHVGSGTLGAWNPRTIRQLSRNQVFLLARHYPTDLARRHAWRIAVAHLLWGAVALKKRRGWVWLTGKLEGLRRFREVSTLR